MDLTNPNTLKSLLSRYHIRLSEKRGQNFLVDKGVLDQIIQTAELSFSDLVLEIGAGAGTLTAALAEKAGKVIAVEKDRKLLRPLRVVVGRYKNVEIIREDIRDFDFHKLISYLPRRQAGKRPIRPPEADQGRQATHSSASGGSGQASYKVVANIPYYLTGELLQQLLKATLKPSLIVLLVQKEVAERITAGPGQSSLLALSVQFFGNPEVVGTVPRTAFFPEPEVDSAILKIMVFPKPRLEVSEKEFFRLVKISFAGRRKTLLNNLSAGFRLPKSEVEKLLQKNRLGPNARAQELGWEEWQRLFEAVKEKHEI